MRDKLKVIYCDIDGILTEGEDCWTEEQVRNAKPNLENIKLLNELDKYHHIIIWSARRRELIPATLDWLDKWGVKRQAYSDKKPAADIYIDNRMEDLKELWKKSIQRS